jgi:purine-cytosine permease-like protein
MADAASARRRETEDYTLTPVPVDARMSWLRILNVTVGIAGAMIFMQISGQMALQFGTVNAMLANAYATIATGVLATIFARVAATTGLNSNLLARACGYGYVGAALTSLIYASQFIILAAIEGSIIAQAINAYLPTLPLSLLMVLITAGNVALNWYGMTQLDKFQKYSLPVYLVLLGTAIALSIRMDLPHATDWPTFMPPGGTIGGAGLLTCIGILNGIVGVQSVLTADYARFIRPEQRGFGALAVGVVPQIASFFLMGTVGIWFAIRFQNANPGIYMVAVMGAWGAAYTVLSQLRINVINVYSGSLSLANFFARVVGFTPGRVFWVMAAALLALVAMLGDVLGHVGPVLTFQGVFMFAWAASMVADLLVVRKTFGVQPRELEYQEKRLRPWNPVGPLALVTGSAIGTWLALASTNPVLTAASAVIAGGTAFVVHVLAAWITRGRYYLAAPAAPGERVLS